ncbi:MAG: hypothetical protein QF546_03915 [Alphaproteobacteria bacterium]|jgi:hypothetical protein|nr:hypothetical protein [Alphaproteobacteria bacterium]HJP22377.1 hypothetical protein [Alphaproteobacteria bacterium]
MRILNQLAVPLLATLMIVSAAQAAPERVRLSGEIIDPWCAITEIMVGRGSAHHQCAIWCAVGGIPVGLIADDGEIYIIMKFETDDSSVANPGLVRVQTNRLVVEGDLYRRDGLNYLAVHKVVDDQGIVMVNHEDVGIQPFGE